MMMMLYMAMIPSKCMLQVNNERSDSIFIFSNKVVGDRITAIHPAYNPHTA